MPFNLWSIYWLNFGCASHRLAQTWARRYWAAPTSANTVEVVTEASLTGATPPHRGEKTMRQMAVATAVWEPVVRLFHTTTLTVVTVGYSPCPKHMGRRPHGEYGRSHRCMVPVGRYLHINTSGHCRLLTLPKKRGQETTWQTWP